jgi:hypothetical protein
VKPIPAIALALLLCGCEEKRWWVVRNEPTTDAERQAVAEQVARILSSAPATLSGHDQDWDDAIRQATESAKESLCKPTLWECGDFRVWTGRWRYLEEIK